MVHFYASVIADTQEMVFLVKVGKIYVKFRSVKIFITWRIEMNIQASEMNKSWNNIIYHLKSGMSLCSI